jgi:hypothetical protein
MFPIYTDRVFIYNSFSAIDSVSSLQLAHHFRTEPTETVARRSVLDTRKHRDFEPIDFVGVPIITPHYCCVVHLLRMTGCLQLEGMHGAVSSGIQNGALRSQQVLF